MGVTKKPAVTAKTARKVRISRTEAAFAASNGVSLEELAKSKLPKRGRPVGSTNKPKAKPIDWEKLAKQLQEALSTEMKANESLQALFDEFKSKIIIAETMPLWKRIRFVITGTL